MQRFSQRHLPVVKALALAAAGAVCLCACASAPPPTLALQGATQAIATADRARISDEASPELHEAREKLAAAQDAVQQEQMDRAERLAQESRVDAELASATIDAAKARAVNAQIIHSDNTLQQEIQRNGAQGKDGATP